MPELNRTKNSEMEYLTPRHRLLVEEELGLLQTKLPTPCHDIQQRMENGELSIRQAMCIGVQCMKQNLSTAVVVWERLLPQVNGKEERKVVLNQLFRVRLALGPWTSALETAQMMFDDVLKAVNATSGNLCPLAHAEGGAIFLRGQMTCA